MAQPSVFYQLMKQIPRSEFEGFVNKHRGNHGVRSLDCWTWFGALLFGQMTGHDSIRAIERIFAKSESHMKKLGLGSVRKSTLADANKTRPLEVLQDTFFYVLEKTKSIAPKVHPDFSFSGKVLALDSTTIELCLALSPWAQFHTGRGAMKLHTAIDVANDLPEFVVLKKGKIQDLPVAKRHFRFKPDTTVVFDRGYLSYDWMNELTQDGVWFVTRSRDCFKFKVLKCQSTDRTQGYICDQIVQPVGEHARKYFGKMRRISFRDPETKKKLIFLTNRFDLTTKTICDLYKARWKVELFFKTLKQNLKIKKFLGTSSHAVKAQIWVALIAYLLVQFIKLSFKAVISMPDAMAVLGTLILIRQPLARLLDAIPRNNRHLLASQLVLNL